MPNEQLQRLGKILDKVPAPCVIVDVSSLLAIYSNAAAGGSEAGSAMPCYRLQHGLDSPCHRHGLPCPIEEFEHSHEDRFIDYSRYPQKARDKTAQLFAHPFYDNLGQLSHILEVELESEDSEQKRSTKKLIELALENAFDPSPEALEDRESLERILAKPKEQPALTPRILDFRRHSKSDSVLVDLYSLVDNQVRDLAAKTPSGIEVSFSTPRSPYTLIGDPAQLRRVLGNLHRNACDAMAEGGCLRYSLEHFEIGPGRTTRRRGMSSGRWIRLTVDDSGQGIPEESLSHVFRPFHTTRSSEHRAGLGLAQVYGIVKKHGGFVDIRSRVGHGTCVEIRLPGFDPRDCPDLSIDRCRSSPKRILIVDDDEALLRRREKILTYGGHEVLAATSGEEVEATLRASDRPVELAMVSRYIPDSDARSLLDLIEEHAPDAVSVLVENDHLPRDADTGDFRPSMSRQLSACQLLEYVQRTVAD